MHKDVFLNLMKERQESKDRNYIYHIEGDEVKSSDYVLVECLDHGESKKSHVSNLRAGKAPCKACGKIARSKGRLHNFEQVKTKIKKTFGEDYYENIDLSRAVYVNSQTKMEVGCKKHNKWFKTVAKSLCMGSYFCPDCQFEKYGARKQWRIEDIKETFDHVHGDKYEYFFDTYTIASNKMKMYCKEHDEIFYTAPCKHTEGQVGCKKCLSRKLSKSQEIPFDQYVKIAKDVQGVDRDYTYHEEFYDSFIGPQIKFSCNKHGGTFVQSKSDHKRGSTACMQCVKEKLHSDSLDDRIETTSKRFEKTWDGKYTYNWGTYTNVDTAMEMHCAEHNRTFWQIPYAHWIGSTGCKNCETSGSSKIESDIHEFIESLGFKTIWGSRSLLENRLEIDIYIPELKVGIEVNGNYWHCDGYDKKFRNYHLNKYEVAKSKDIDLIYIWEYEWNTRKELIKNFLKNRLGVSDKPKIYARNTYVRFIQQSEKTEVKSFLNDNHIQGAPKKVSTTIGIYHKNTNECLGYMLFRNKGDYTYELQRYATNCNVVGGASKCFKYFCRNIEFKHIISFSDRQHFSGELYPKLGFEYDSLTKPSYVVFHRNLGDAIHKANWRRSYFKQRLEEVGYEFKEEFNSMTEFELQDKFTFYRLWDAGKIKWVYTK